MIRFACILVNMLTCGYATYRFGLTGGALVLANGLAGITYCYFRVNEDND